MKKTFFLLGLILPLFASATEFEPYFPFYNRSYVIYSVTEPVNIDGDIYTPEWEKAEWTEDFMDIEGPRNTVAPKYRTRAKMLWDKKYLYLAVELEEPHIWGTLKNRDAVIFWDNDIEFFIDPFCGSKNYREFEFNTLNTQWDLLLTAPERRGGLAIFEWDVNGMKTAVKHYGTVNDPSDIDTKWTFEAAIPIASLTKHMYPGAQWRLNFSRVEWLKVSHEGGTYTKNPGTNNFGHESNWLWVPTGVVDAHRPERWGWIQFSGITVGEGTEQFNWNNGHEYMEALWTVSNRIRQYRFLKGKMPESFEDLELENPMGIRYIKISDNDYHVSVTTDFGVVYSTMANGTLEQSNSRRVRISKDRTPGRNPYEGLMSDKMPSPAYGGDTTKILRFMF